jgi:membrane protein YqaA with SNARE-associated domain
MAEEGNMFDLLRSFSHWVEGFAGTPWAMVILVVNSFTESIINPIPVDPLLIGMGILNPNMALIYAGLATVSSVAGAVAGHWLGLRCGRPLVLKMVSEKKVTQVESLFQRYGVWAILVAAITPIPYKVFAVTAGVLRMDRYPFIVASLIGRGVRFFLLGGLIFFFGASIQQFIETQFELLTVIFSVVLVLALVAGLVIMRYRRATGVVELREEQPAESD